MINTKDKIIEYFNSGIKDTKKLKIGIEHEKFLFNNLNNKRIDYKKIKEMFSALLEFGWNPILEKGNIIGLNKGGKNITLEPGNQIELSGDKWSQKQYISHTGYPGGQRIITADKLHQKNNIKLVEKAVKGMLPKNKLGSELYRNLKVFPGSEHSHEAQKPKLIDVNSKI